MFFPGRYQSQAGIIVNRCIFLSFSFFFCLNQHNKNIFLVNFFFKLQSFDIKCSLNDIPQLYILSVFPNNICLYKTIPAFFSDQHFKPQWQHCSRVGNIRLKVVLFWNCSMDSDRHLCFPD